LNTEKKYDIYFTCAMTEQTKNVRRRNVNFGLRLHTLCEELGYNIFDPEKMDVDGNFPEDEIFDEDRKILEKCGLVVAFLDKPSCGAGGEITICHYFEIPVILISRNLKQLSPFVTTNKQVKERITFTDIESIMSKLRKLIPVYMNGHG